MPIPDVLVVDDEADIRLIAVLSLSKLAGWTVRAVGSAGEALEAIGHRRPDVILLDARLPDMDGLAVLAELRARAAGVPVVFVTAMSRHEDVQAFLAAGASGVIAKPFDPTVLAAQIQRIVGSFA